MEATPPDVPDAAFRLALHLQRRRDLIGAQIVYERALSRHPESWRLRNALSNLYIWRGRPAQGLALLDAAPEGSLDNARAKRSALENRARAYVGLGRLDELEALLPELEAMGTPRGERLFLAARAAFKGGRRDEGLAALEDALAERREPIPESQLLWALLVQGREYQNAGRDTDALDAYRKARTLDPDNRDVVAFFERLKARERR